ncbi:hypothetical protein [Aeromonas sp. FDAARGOS 1417]|uniref:hypothetical protein n=1 Tax=Aeromonas TaxID=642 RepID=UPI001C23A84E|nr:hypothetical protein [Aeromonas sp. FDAARGOS 1417]QWZ62762.1 hypothetical protein I6L47_13590 [Aeromonas sp. FDAARGOS 1417]
MTNLGNRGIQNYIFLNSEMIESICHQVFFGEMKAKYMEKNVSVGTSGINVGFNIKEKDITSILYKLKVVEELIDKESLKINFRPSTLDMAYANSFSFVKETFDAYKVIIPMPENIFSEKTSHIVLWVSEPDPQQYVNDGLNYLGTFLFLVESFNATPAFREMISGCSALQYVYNLSKDLDESARHQSGEEPFGRWNFIHPLDKIKSMGGKVVSKKKITSLYKMKYFTNEQSYTFNQQERRVNDLLSYPIYIIEEDAYSVC